MHKNKKYSKKNVKKNLNDQFFQDFAAVVRCSDGVVGLITTIAKTIGKIERDVFVPVLWLKENAQVLINGRNYAAEASNKVITMVAFQR